MYSLKLTLTNGNPLQDCCLGNSVDREPGRLQSMGSQRVGHNWVTNTHNHKNRNNRNRMTIFETLEGKKGIKFNVTVKENFLK